MQRKSYRNSIKYLDKFKNLNMAVIPVNEESLMDVAYDTFFKKPPKSFKYADRVYYTAIRLNLTYDAMQRLALQGNYRDAFDENNALKSDMDISSAADTPDTDELIRKLGYTPFSDSKALPVETLANKLKQLLGGSILMAASTMQFAHIVMNDYYKVQYKLMNDAGGLYNLISKPQYYGKLLLFQQNMLMIKDMLNVFGKYSSPSSISQLATFLKMDEVSERFGDDVEGGALTVEAIALIAEKLGIHDLLKEIKDNPQHITKALKEALHDEGLPVLDARQTSVEQQMKDAGIILDNSKGINITDNNSDDDDPIYDHYETLS